MEAQQTINRDKRSWRTGGKDRCVDTLCPPDPDGERLCHEPHAWPLTINKTRRSALMQPTSARVAVALGFDRRHADPRLFTAKRPTGEQVTVTIAPSGFGNLITFVGTPPHDVTDVVRAYQHSAF